MGSKAPTDVEEEAQRRLEAKRAARRNTTGSAPTANPPSAPVRPASKSEGGGGRARPKAPSGKRRSVKEFDPNQ